jgi:hypothetical protein
MISFGGAVLSRGSRGLCSLAHVSGALGMKHVVAQFGLTLTSTFLGLGLIYLVVIRSSRCTPSLRTLDWKRVTMIINIPPCGLLVGWVTVNLQAF